MSDTMQELLELVEENKESMNNGAYLNLVNGLQELYRRTNGNYTTDYRQMYIDLHLEQHKLTRLLDKADQFIELAGELDKYGSGKIYWTYRQGIAYGYVNWATYWRKYCVERRLDGIGYQRDYFYPNMKLEQKVMIDKDYQIHCSDGPAIKQYDQKGKIISEQWYEHGLPIRTISLCRSTVLETEHTKYNGIQFDHTCLYKNKKGKRFLVSEYWCKDFCLHKEGDHPAMITYSKKKPGVKRYEAFYLDGVKIRSKRYCPNGETVLKEIVYKPDNS